MKALRTPDSRFDALPDFPFAPRYVDVGDGLRMHYVDEGPKDGPVVLLMHGEPTWSFLYRKMIPILAAAGVRAVAPDLVGFGRSDKPVDPDAYTYARHVGWMRTFVTGLSLEGITLFAQDWGSLVGLRLAAENEARFSRIVIANGFLPTARQKTPPAFHVWRAFSRWSPVFPIGRIVASGCVVKPSAAVRAAYDAPFPSRAYKAGARIFPSLVPTTESDPAIPANRAAWDVLGRWEKPFLTLFGKNDPILGRADAPLQAQVPGAKGQPHERFWGGHFVQEDRGDHLAERTVAWLRGLGVAGLLAMAAGCGGRTSPSVPRDAGVEQGEAGTPVAPTRCTWAQAGAAVRVSGDPMVAGDVGLASAIPSSNGVLVAWITPSNLTTAQTVTTRFIGFDGTPIGSEHVILRAAGVAKGLDHVALAAGSSRVGVSATDGSRGCVLRPLTVDGASNGSEVLVDTRACSDLATTSAGYDVYLHSTSGFAALFLQRLDPTGAPLGPAWELFDNLLGDGLQDQDRASQSEPWFFAAARFQQSSATRVLVQRCDETGKKTKTPTILWTSNEGLATVSLATTASGAVVTWGARSSVWEIRGASLDQGGSLARQPTVLVSSKQSMTAQHVASDDQGGALLAWIERGADGDAARVQPLDASGGNVGAPFALGAPQEASSLGPAVRVVASGGRAVALVEAFSTTTPHRVYAVPLACTR
jgi:haloalkane dehalogenase